MSITQRLWRSMTARVAVAYAAIAVVMTWPLVRTLDSRLAADLGDPAFLCWTIEWTAGTIIEALKGHVSALATYWDANIFYPAPLALAYSDHMTAQALQALPLYAATGNIILTYNVLFISTFAVCGLGAYLLVRDLTGRPLAAFFAGLAYAYAPYRMGQFSHLQILSSGWMAFTLWGFHRYFARLSAGRHGWALARPLAAAVCAQVLQNHSSGYFMVFFAPFAAAYCLYEMTQRRLWTNRRALAHLALAAGAIGALTWPFVTPYLQVQHLPGMGTRSLGDAIGFSAAAQAFGTAPNRLWLWGERIRSYVKAEGEGFPGFTMLTFAAVAMFFGVPRLVRRIPWKDLGDAQAIATALAGVLAFLSGALLLAFFVSGHVTIPGGTVTVMYAQTDATLITFALMSVLWLVLSALARRRDARLAPHALGFFAVAALTAALLALGPRIQSFGHSLGTGPYYFLFMHVPGFQGLRVPARFLMLVMLFLSVLAGLGAAEVLRSRFRRLASLIVVAACACVLAEGWVAPIRTNVPMPPGEGLARPPDVASGKNRRPIYRVIRDLPGHVVLAEFPFGDLSYELQAVFYAGYHRRPILNGYSGFFPPEYAHRAAYLADALTRPAEAARALREGGATHVLVHEWAYLDHRGPEVSRWLEGLGARLVTMDDGDALYMLPAPR